MKRLMLAATIAALSTTASAEEYQHNCYEYSYGPKYGSPVLMSLSTNGTVRFRGGETIKMKYFRSGALRVWSSYDELDQIHLHMDGRALSYRFPVAGGKAKADALLYCRPVGGE